MRIAMVSLPCLVLSLAGCSGNNAPKPTPPPPPTPTAATPTFSVIAGMYTAAQTVTIRDATAGATVYYTTNGTAPTASSTPYTGPVTVSSTETLMAAAIAPGYLLSAVASASYTITPPPPPPAPSGAVLHGQVPVAGAHVYVFSANAAGYGQASISLLNPALTCASDSIGAYVTTGSDGTFAITGDYTCMANTQVYLYALGGDSGSGNNPASGLLAVMGNCPTSGSFSAMTAKIAVNEVSTIAAAYAMAGFATDATHVSSSGTALAQIGITNAFANAASLADLSTGAALAATPAGNGVVPQSEIDTLADILAACVGAVNAGSCSTLFENATSDGTAIGTQPSDTATAAINIAHHPGSNVAALFALSADSSAFAPALATEPNDFTVELVFTVPNEDTD
ncbi:MAG: chitobiase/beta-hexosaminidase C-terminal domain-containing protein, partial [Terracidiphilus sp.]